MLGAYWLLVRFTGNTLCRAAPRHCAVFFCFFPSENFSARFARPKSPPKFPEISGDMCQKIPPPFQKIPPFVLGVSANKGRVFFEARPRSGRFSKGGPYGFRPPKAAENLSKKDPPLQKQDFSNKGAGVFFDGYPLMYFFSKTCAFFVQEKHTVIGKN